MSKTQEKISAYFRKFPEWEVSSIVNIVGEEEALKLFEKAEKEQKTPSIVYDEEIEDGGTVELV
jgi:hypothetical protein